MANPFIRTLCRLVGANDIQQILPIESLMNLYPNKFIVTWLKAILLLIVVCAGSMSPAAMAASLNGNADVKLTKISGGSTVFDFTALNVSGQPTIPGTGAKVHPCVRDNATGLTWEVKTNDGGLRDQNWTYTWYDSNTFTNGGSAGYSSGTCLTAGHCDTEKYAQDVNATKLCGYTDWRMPTVKELETIVDPSRTNPAIDPTYFPNTIASTFWSGSAYAGSSNAAWGSCFHGGYADNYVKFLTFPVRLVRGGKVNGNI